MHLFLLAIVLSVLRVTVSDYPLCYLQIVLNLMYRGEKIFRVRPFLKYQNKTTRHQ